MKKNNNKQLFFKYRSLKGENFARFIDIIYNSRLYGASYKDLNDPMEGRYDKKGLKSEDFEIINGSLKRSFICSFSKKQENQNYRDVYLMWSHYADGHRGCCIEFSYRKTNEKYWKVNEINYNNILPKFSKENKNSVDEFLYNKIDCWKYEQEWRAVKHYEKAKNTKNQSKPSPYFYIDIHAVYIGSNNTKKRMEYYRDIIHAIDKKIKVYGIKWENSQDSEHPILNAFVL